jgi:hypothetical protein
MEEKGVEMKFEADDEEEQGEGLQMGIGDVFGAPKPKRARLGGSKVTKGMVYADIV